ncbi:MAG: AraC family transcriptional regulator, partial [Bacilli bacterium]
NYQEWIGKLKQEGVKLLKQQDSELPKQDLIQRVQTYVEKHYMKNIGLCQIASEVEVTPSYLSTQFHKKTGTTFIKYLTKLRILKAQELLASTNMQIQQVAEQVGYFSTRHFTKLFMEIVGTYPSDFKKMHNQPTFK